MTVMHLVDSLAVGGAERVAVSLANELLRRGAPVHVCTTRAEGPLARLLAPGVGRLSLERTVRFSLRAAHALQAYIYRHGIDVLHAHGTSLFVATLASLAPPHPRLIWHDHYGGRLTDRTALPYWLLSKRASVVLAVNEELARWSRETLGVPRERVLYLPNFPAVVPAGEVRSVQLPGTKGQRVVCVANLRPQKDHLNLISAMRIVLRAFPQAHLICVGNDSTPHAVSVKTAVRRWGLEHQISLLGERLDVGDVLRGCDLGVLSSRSEGLPLALLEYGSAELPAVATRVGQCAEVLQNGEAGILVPSEDPAALAEAIMCILRDPATGARLGQALAERVRGQYSLASAVDKLREVYRAVVM